MEIYIYWRRCFSELSPFRPILCSPFLRRAGEGEVYFGAHNRRCHIVGDAMQVEEAVHDELRADFTLKLNPIFPAKIILRSTATSEAFFAHEES
jgi:hypothetical protein